MKKVCSIFMALLLCVGVIGCESNNSKEKAKNEEFIDKVIEVFDKNMSIYQRNLEGVAERLVRNGDTLDVVAEEVKLKEEIQLINGGYYSVQDYSIQGSKGLFSFSKYDNIKKEGKSIDVSIEEFMPEDEHHAWGEERYYVWTLEDEVYGNDIEGWVNWIEKYEQFFDCTIKEQGSNKVLIFECTDIKGFNKKYYEDLKKTNPTYDPLDVDGLKASKNEFTKYKLEFIFDKEYNLLTSNQTVNHDYGNGLVAKSKSTCHYSRLTTPTFTINEIEEYFKNAK